jgi:hypothetical protein
MKIIGIPLQRPSFNQFTAASVLAIGLWLAALGILQTAGWGLDRNNAGALLVVMWWGSLSAPVGIRIGEGQRHLLANLVVSGLLLGAYEGLQRLVA